MQGFLAERKSEGWTSVTPRRAGCLDVVPAVDRQLDTSDEAGLLGGEAERGGDVVRAGEPAERDGCDNSGTFFGRVVRAAESPRRPVSPVAGEITLTRMPSPPSSTASDRASTQAAPWEAPYQVSPGRDRRPMVDPVCKITPLRRTRINGTRACTR